MVPKFILMTAALAAVAAPTLSAGLYAAPYAGQDTRPYYLARIPYTTRCTIVRTVPDGRNLFQVGYAFPTLGSARIVKSSAVDCVTKRRPGSP